MGKAQVSNYFTFVICASILPTTNWANTPIELMVLSWSSISNCAYDHFCLNRSLYDHDRTNNLKTFRFSSAITDALIRTFFFFSNFDDLSFLSDLQFLGMPFYFLSGGMHGHGQDIITLSRTENAFFSKTPSTHLWKIATLSCWIIFLFSEILSSE